jgi:hypothetical protein
MTPSGLFGRALAAIAILAGLCPEAGAQTGGKFGTSPAAFLEQGVTKIQLPYSGGSPPGGLAPYLYCGSGENPWRVYWSKAKTDPPAVAGVSCVKDDHATSNLVLALSAPLPDGPPNTVSWTVLFTPPSEAKLLPQLIAVAPVIPSSPPGTAVIGAARSCDAGSASKPFFCPPAAGGKPADFSMTANFLAAGGTKPIYKLELLDNTYTDPLPGLLDFRAGLNLAVEINQNTKPPQNRTRFDPDSILAAAALSRIVTVQKGILYQVQLDEALPGGEFSRSDPSSNLIFRTTATFVLNSWQPGAGKPVPAGGSGRRFYASLYPVLAMEGGKNLNRPALLAKTPIDLSRYDAIARGVLGAQAQLGLTSPDKKTDEITLAGTYRVRLPAFDEPFVATTHGVTSAVLTTKARHWVEIDLSYAPFGFKYLAFTAQYQYGDLPPVFTLVDHSVSIGLTLKASQTNSPPPAPIK